MYTAYTWASTYTLTVITCQNQSLVAPYIYIYITSHCTPDCLQIYIIPMPNKCILRTPIYVHQSFFHWYTVAMPLVMLQCQHTFVWKTCSESLFQELFSSATASWGYSPLHGNVGSTCNCIQSMYHTLAQMYTCMPLYKSVYASCNSDRMVNGNIVTHTHNAQIQLGLRKSSPQNTMRGV